MRFNNWKVEKVEKIDSQRLASLEFSCGYKLPSEFKEWLELVNGSSPEKEYLSIPNYGVTVINHVYALDSSDRDQIDVFQQLLEGNLPKGYLSFATTPGGDEFVIALSKNILTGKKVGNVFYWDHETNNFVKLAENMQGFNDLLQDEPDDPSEPQFYKILKADDDKLLNEWLVENSIESKDEGGWTIMETATSFQSYNCIRLLHSKGAELGRSLEKAKENVEFFNMEEFTETIALLEELYKE